MAKFFDENGNEVQGIFQEDVDALIATKVTEAVKTKETEFATVKTTLEQELTQAKTALGERTGEFKNFRKLNDDVVAKLDIAQRTIYENGLALEEARIARETSDKTIREAQIDSVLRAKAGSDDKLFEKMKDMWAVIGINAETPEAIEGKAKMILGAISTTEPDLLASVGFKGGSWQPPETEKKTNDTIPRTESGKKLAEALGLKL